MNPDSGGMPASENSGTSARQATAGCDRYIPPRAPQVGGSSLPQEQAADEEEGRDHQHVMQHVENRAAERSRCPQRETDRREADVADEVERQHAAEIVLGDGADQAHHHRDGREHQDSV